jgi:hypothetical protein
VFELDPGRDICDCVTSYVNHDQDELLFFVEGLAEPARVSVASARRLLELPILDDLRWRPEATIAERTKGAPASVEIHKYETEELQHALFTSKYAQVKDMPIDLAELGKNSAPGRRSSQPATSRGMPQAAELPERRSAEDGASRPPARAGRARCGPR